MSNTGNFFLRWKYTLQAKISHLRFESFQVHQEEKAALKIQKVQIEV